MKRFLMLLLVCIEAGCNTVGQNNFRIMPLIICPDKNDCTGADIRLSITNISETDSTTIYKAISSYKDKNIGLIVVIPKAHENSQGFGKGMIIKSIGKESDNLLGVLASLYKQKATNEKFIESVAAAYVNLGEFAQSLAGDKDHSDPNTIIYKVFFESKDDEAELFLNINSTDKWIDLREKDEGYRASIIKMLAR